MKEKIKENLIQLEKENNVSVIYACESGSRAWGFPSKDSDYDVRFVFVRPLQEYIQLTKPKEVISIAFDKNLKKSDPRGAVIDISGFDVLKYTKLKFI